MNFEQVKQANGNNVTMFATFAEVGGIMLNKNQKQVSKCQLVDDNKEQHIVRLYGTMPLPTLLNTRQEFSLSSYQGTNQRGQPYTGYSGFWNDRAMVNQVPDKRLVEWQAEPPAPQAPAQTQQAPQPPAQVTNIPLPIPQPPVSRGMNMPDTYAYPVTPETADRMARAICIEALLQNGQKPLYSYVTELVDYIRTGKEPMVNVSNSPDSEITNQDNQEICQKCGGDETKCNCPPW